MVYKNGFVKSQLSIERGEQLTVGVNGVLLSGFTLEGDATAVVKGTVVGRDRFAALVKDGGRWDVEIEATAVVTGQNGLTIEGSDGRLSNAGRIFVEGVAVSAQGRDNTFTNKGFVEGELGISFGGQGSSLVNEANAIITGSRLGVSGEGSIANYGTIVGEDAIRLMGSFELINKGVITGNITVHGTGTLDMRGGELNGVIRSQAWDVTVITDDSDLQFISSEYRSAVKASVDYALGNGVGKLILIGKADINGKGNGQDNVLTGNDGNNTMRGMQGRDEISGGQGDDTLSGGADRDYFVFALGDGHDVITDFDGSKSDGQRDMILLGQGMVVGVQSFKEFMEEHVHNDGQGNVKIEFDDQSITLLGVQKADLISDDFRF